MELSNNAKKIFEMKYAQEQVNGGLESWPNACGRVAEYVARGEEDENAKLQYMAEFTRILLERSFLPGGRILANAGTPIKNMFNCFVLPVEDSREGIYQALAKSAEIFAWGGGIGYNFSNLRARGSEVGGTGGKASGPLSFMELFDLTGEVISQASRRGAQMGILNVDHPDIVDFINYKNKLNDRNRRVIEEFDRNLEHEQYSGIVMKHDFDRMMNILSKTLADGQLTHFNISVGVTDKFMNNPDGDILELIAKNAWENGDPGIFFIDRSNEDSLVPYLGRIQATNPCLHPDTLLLDGDRLNRISSGGKTWDSWETGTKDVVKLTTNAGHEIILTPDHEIMLEDGEFVEAQNSVGRTLRWALGDRSTTNIIDEYVLKGFLFGDGFINGSGYGISVKLNPDKEPEVANMLEGAGFNQQDSGAFYINRNSLEGLGFLEDRVWNRNIPEDIITGDSSVVASFLRGLFEANGSCTKKSQISLKTTNKQLAKDVQVLLASFGIPSWITANKPAEIEWENGTYESKESYNLQIAPRNSYTFLEEIGFLSERKNNRIQYLEGEYRSKLKVESIEPAGQSEVWDFSNQPHYNLANGIIAHNCGEVPLLPYEPCCLGSINLSQFVDGDFIDFNYLNEVVELAVRFLDNVHTINQTPVEEVNEAAQRTRRLGLGVMGWADMLAEMGIPYDHEDAFTLAGIMAKTIQKTAWEASMKLAEEREPFPAFEEDKINWDVIDNLELERNPVRNVAVTSIAPTGSISLIADCNSGIEPFFSHKYIRNITEGVGNTAKDAMEQNSIDESVKVSHEIHWKDHIRMQSAWQQYVDNAVSKTINMPNDATVEDIIEAYSMAWREGLKGLTVYRDGSRSFQILNRDA